MSFQELSFAFLAENSPDKDRIRAFMNDALAVGASMDEIISHIFHHGQIQLAVKAGEPTLLVEAMHMAMQPEWIAPQHANLSPWKLARSALDSFAHPVWSEWTRQDTDLISTCFVLATLKKSNAQVNVQSMMDHLVQVPEKYIKVIPKNHLVDVVNAYLQSSKTDLRDSGLIFDLIQESFASNQSRIINEVVRGLRRYDVDMKNFNQWYDLCSNWNALNVKNQQWVLNHVDFDQLHIPDLALLSSWMVMPLLVMAERGNHEAWIENFSKQYDFSGHERGEYDFDADHFVYEVIKCYMDPHSEVIKNHLQAIIVKMHDVFPSSCQWEFLPDDLQELVQSANLESKQVSDQNLDGPTAPDSSLKKTIYQPLSLEQQISPTDQEKIITGFKSIAAVLSSSQGSSELFQKPNPERSKLKKTIDDLPKPLTRGTDSHSPQLFTQGQIVNLLVDVMDLPPSDPVRSPMLIHLTEHLPRSIHTEVLQNYLIKKFLDPKTNAINISMKGAWVKNVESAMKDFVQDPSPTHFGNLKKAHDPNHMLRHLEQQLWNQTMSELCSHLPGAGNELTPNPMV